MRKFLQILILIALVSILLAACSSGNNSTSGTSPTAQSGTVADGKTLLEDRCQSCHTLARVVNARGDASQWQAVVTDMVNRGAVLSADEQQVLVQYLAANFK